MSDVFIDKIVVDSVENKTKDTDLASEVSELAQDITELSATVAGLTGKTLCFTNKTVETTDWVDQSSDPDITGYPYRAAVTTTGTTSDFSPDVRFDVADAASGIFAPVAACDTNVTYIYASEAPSADIAIPVIICMKAV